MACLGVAGHYFLLTISKCWFARSICFKTHSHHLQAKMECYCVQVGCLFLGGYRPHPEANGTTAEETEPLGVKTLFSQRSTCDQRHTFRGSLHAKRGRNTPQGTAVVRDSHCVKDTNK